MPHPPLPPCLAALRREQPVAYFSMEVALRPELPTYAGGLGVLAGDLVRTAADLGLPLCAVTLLCRDGYFQQSLGPDGAQREAPIRWDPAALLTPLAVTTTVALEGRAVVVRAWLHACESVVGRAVPVLFLDTDAPENAPDDRAITHALYGGDAAYRLRQEIVLGIGGVRLLRALGLRVRKYHINEGHAALLALELLAETPGATPAARLRAVRERCVFTTHTPVAAAQDRFPLPLVRRLLGDALPLDDLLAAEDEGDLNLTRLALRTAGYVNGVAERHREVSAEMFPGRAIAAITNGVHSHTWTAPPMRRVFDRHLPGWAAEPQLLARADCLPDHEVWMAHQEAKGALFAHVLAATGVALDPDALTLGFARRFTAYKRPCLVFADLARLRRVARRGRLQLVFAGKAHPRDAEGRRLIAEVVRHGQALGRDVPVVFLPDYDLTQAALLVAGVDLWLNTPQPPLEASGTSGMKAAHNGVPNFSVLDGWWLEGHQEGVTGWSIGPPAHADVTAAARAAQEVDDLYGKLEYLILPTWYSRPSDWIRVMKGAIDHVASYFNAHRMLRRYVTDAYFPLANPETADGD